MIKRRVERVSFTVANEIGFLAVSRGTTEGLIKTLKGVKII